ncbi:MAG TPA: chemotaxis protein CheB [Pyrinomonadaceae bacterium]|nr:chemotaxis protein CheB [Pyrinomonadaceae bacterium]
MAKNTSPRKKSADTKAPPPALSPSDDHFLIVGLGASAGGIQALREFFSKVPRDSQMAYVVILHMSPEHESKLAEILQVSSPIPVAQVQQRVKVQPNHVYVIPPNQNLAMNDGHIELKYVIGVEERRSPVDLFFRTLAETKEDFAVSVILSGTGADGSMGLKRVKEYGGVAFVQDPAEAEYPDMPRNAIATGMVDYVLPVSQIPAKIVSYRDHIGTVTIPQEPAKTDEQALLDIFTQLRLRTGHDFSNYKRATMLRRIERRLGLRELPGLDVYARYLRDNAQEVQLLMKDLLISVTNFFRDPETIEALGEMVIPKVFDHKAANEPARVWVAGCATGEEAYSIAMVLSEYLAASGKPLDFQVFATDLDIDAIKVAREAYYRDAEVADVSPERLRRFFNREPDGYRVRRELRESILFAAHNVLKDPPFSHLDLISCRNLLIYLNRKAQNRVLEVLHFALNPVGYLLLGSSESVDGVGDLFGVVDKSHHIYRSRPVATRALPIPDLTIKLPRLEGEKRADESKAVERLSHADLHQRMLEQYGPPSLIVNEDYEIVHLSDRAGQYLHVSGGEPSQNLLKLAREGIRLELRTALYQAVHDGVNVESRGIKVVTDEGPKTVNLHVRPVLREEDASRGFILVMFQEVDPLLVEPSKEEVTSPSEPLARRLEEELTHAKAQLRATVEQYEIQQEELRASNEELQAMNEELRSAAEELETSKEELQSVNEELTTVNQELKIKIEELSQANNNFQNLMNSTDIGTIFLDRALQVRQFTPAARDTFNLISTDIGRPLMDITSKLKTDNLLPKLELVLSNLQPLEREVKSPDDQTYIMRISPYRTLDDRIDGLVITLVEVTARARAEALVKKAGEELETKIEKRTGELASANVALRREIRDKERAEDARILLLDQLVSTQEEERRRLARELHDQLGQQLTSLRLRLESLKNGNNKDHNAAIDELEGIVKQLDADVDFLAWELRPLALDELGLETALANYVAQWSERSTIPVGFHSAGLDEQRLAPEIESNFYRIAQEALNNCAKHSKCKHVDVIIERRENDAVLIIEDDGIGFDTQADSQGSRVMGLVGMHERAIVMGGTFEVESAPGKGTTIFVRVPFTSPRREDNHE